MFGFHKPKPYRSIEGCCICRAKSSSSHFTDSKRYEIDLNRCFGLREVCCGDICNAHVLLIKRWKKLSAGSMKNWSHLRTLSVVGAKAVPSMKSTLKMKKIKKKLRPSQISWIQRSASVKYLSVRVGQCFPSCFEILMCLFPTSCLVLSPR
uniref:SIN3-HDAC complex associated factor, like n=1 Tax=Mola mola TaxID=94237 RepID=A0A3Q3WKP5_MOLML